MPSKAVPRIATGPNPRCVAVGVASVIVPPIVRSTPVPKSAASCRSVQPADRMVYCNGHFCPDATETWVRVQNFAPTGIVVANVMSSDTR